MRCQRCGFELEAGQTFCPMCGTEQSRAEKKSKSWKPKSILWVIKVSSKSHLWMWVAFFCSLALLITTCFLPMTPLNISCICLESILVAYEIFNILVGYKNPNSTKTKAYKIRYKLCYIITALLLLITLFLDFAGLSTWINETVLKAQGKR